MKKIKIIIGYFLSTFLMTGCNFMDCDEADNYSKEDVLASYTRVEQLVTNVYGHLQHGFCNIDGAMQDAATDDAVHIYESSSIQYFVNGMWSPDLLVDDLWVKYYSGIRAANLYLKETEGLTFSEYEYGDNYENIMKEFNNYKYEVRFLRAYFYFELVKRYRNVPLVLGVLSQEEANEMPSTSYEEIVKFIVDECTDVAKYLPVSYSSFQSKEYGRITKAAALALKSRVTLYMASPLFSEDSDEKWKTAAKAAYEIIGSASELGCSLGKYADLFGETNNMASEVILARSVGETGDFEKLNFPVGIGGNRGTTPTSTCPTQNLVDAYETADGKPFDWNNPDMAKNPYANRDKRLDMTIAYNGMVWPVKPLEIWEGGANGLPIQYATTTGYYLKKYLNNSISFESDSKVTKKYHNWILFRYGEILLNYAEAMVNAFNDPNYKNAELKMSALEAVNLVRDRSDVKMPLLPDNLNADDFLKRVKNERRVELAFEGHRFWDLRRWKALDETTNIYGVKVEKSGEGFKYTKFLFANRTITDNLYFYPISNLERYKNLNLGQNPGW